MDALRSLVCLSMVCFAVTGGVHVSARSYETLSDLGHLSNDQFEELFRHKYKDVSIPGEDGVWIYCAGRSYLRPGPRIVDILDWPVRTFLRKDLNQVISLYWRGKFLKKQGDMAMVMQEVVPALRVPACLINPKECERKEPQGRGVARISEVALGQDGHPAMIIDYADDPLTFFRGIKDDVRRVGDHLWLIRAFTVPYALCKSLGLPTKWCPFWFPGVSDKDYHFLGYFALECRDLVGPNLPS